MSWESSIVRCESSRFRAGEADFEVLGDAGQVAQQVARGATVNGHRRLDDEQARALLFHEATLG